MNAELRTTVLNILWQLERNYLDVCVCTLTQLEWAVNEHLHVATEGS